MRTTPVWARRHRDVPASAVVLKGISAGGLIGRQDGDGKKGRILQQTAPEDKADHGEQHREHGTNLAGIEREGGGTGAGRDELNSPTGEQEQRRRRTRPSLIGLAVVPGEPLLHEGIVHGALVRRGVAATLPDLGAERHAEPEHEREEERQRDDADLARDTGEKLWPQETNWHPRT